MKLVWTLFGVVCPAWRMPRVSSFVCSIPPIALACCLAVPPSVADSLRQVRVNWVRWEARSR